MRDGEDGDTWPATGPVEKLDLGGATIMRFKLGSVLGRGGMGEVLSAHDDQLGRSVAIKRLRSEAPTKSAVTRFLREVRIQGRLEHPAIVPVYQLDYGSDNLPFFVMKQLTGVTLTAVLRDLAAGVPEVVAKFSRQRLLRTFADICLAIEFAHTRGVVHRDLKPANIVLGDFGEVYVLDWGIAHVMVDDARSADFVDIHTFDDNLMVDGMILGSPGYMSPEQIRVESDLDGRSDVYALGCILFELLTFEPLHESGLAGVALALTGVEARPSVRAPERDVPPELDVICARSTMTERKDRYASARELHDAISRFLDGDRDVALRRELAKTELAEARLALERGNTSDHRRDALRAAARALALDPTSKEPAELVGRLMLEPPKDIPVEVSETLDRGDDDALFAARRLIILAAIAFLLFLPILYVVGFRHPVFLVGSAVIPAAMWLLAATASRDRVRLVAYTGLVGNSAMAMLYAWVATPFLVAPALAAVTAISLSTHPRIARSWVLVTTISACVLAPLVLEWLGALPQSMVFAGDTMTLRVHAEGLEQTTTTIALVLYVIALTTMGVVLGRSLTGDRRAAQRTLEIQSWQLRQLVSQ
ncbi:MAG: serine/threonine-protein kinase [Kofleriaceae bacterium]